MENVELISIFIVFIFGISIGSFLNVVIYRLPLQKSIISPPSSCPVCGAKIKPWHNIPILGWIILKGKCANCSAKISIRYPIIEVLTGIIAVIVYKKTGLNIFFAINFAIFATLLALSVIDFDYKAVPDSLNLLALSLAFFSSTDIINNFTNALILMGGMSLIRYYVSYIIKREAMGEGDIIVGGTMGALLGIKLALMALFIGSFVAILPSLYNRIKNNDVELPFIPFLALGTFIVWIFNSYFEILWSNIYG
jgi:leader peptidase (prepilin peptidase)/N-methyltransferase